MPRVDLFRLVFVYIAVLLFCLFVALPATALARDKKIRAKVTVILDKLPAEKKKRMATFQDKLTNYLHSRAWVEEDYVNPFQIGLQLFLEDEFSTVEDRYRCSILVSGPDIQYYDKRGRFPFQENEEIKPNAEYLPVLGLVDFYVYLVIANELDKYGAMEGTPYFDKARSVLQQGKFSRFFEGWDRREELLRATSSENYKKFRELKDYYFYGLSLKDDELAQKRDYVKQAAQKLEDVLYENKDNLAAKQFIDAHYLEIIDLFKNADDNTVFKILIRLDPDRAKLYEEYVQ
jgi:hypothetical protein